MKKIFLLFSHTLTESQKKDIRLMGIQDIIYLPHKYRIFWSQIPAEGDLPIEVLNEIVKWLQDNSNKGDYVLVQGEFGAVFYIVDFCLQYGLIPLYSTTSRNVLNEEGHNSIILKTNTFEHVTFRRYVKYTHL